MFYKEVDEEEQEEMDLFVLTFVQTLPGFFFIVKDPNEAPEGSIRRTILEKWEEVRCFIIITKTRSQSPPPPPIIFV